MENRVYKIKPVFFPPLLINYENSKKHIPALDGLRGIAILLVILFHTFHFLLGWCGVDLFFVLSGFLITGSLLDSKQDIHYFKKFWIKRILRIFPLYYIVLIIILIPKDFFGIDTVSFSSWSYWFYVQNWIYVYNGVFPDGKDTLNHFWSLAIEEQFYFVFPFIIKFVPEKKLKSVLITFIIIAITFRYYYLSIENIGYYVATLSRLDALSIGALLAYLIRHQMMFLQKWTTPVFYCSTLYIFTAIFLGGDIHFSNPYLAGFGLTAFALLFGCLLIYSLCTFKTNFFNSVLSNTYLMFIGKIAYGLYVFHWILYVLIKPPLEEIIFNAIHLSIISKIIVSVVVLIASIILSYFSYHYFEKRVMRLRNVL